MKKVLITGGLGFIGTNLVRRLLASTDYEITILDKFTYAATIPGISDLETSRRISIIKGDICKRGDVEHAVKNASIVIHLAADTNAYLSLSHASQFIHTNVYGTTVLLETLEKHSVDRVILLSSSEVYGNKIGRMPMDENHVLHPVTPYAASKLAAEFVTLSFYLTKKIPAVIFRAFNAYGPYQYPEKMIPLFITHLLQNLPITLSNGGKPKRDWIYVDDIARAIELALQMPIEKIQGEVFNLGTGKATSVATVADLILKTIGKNQSLIKIAPSSRPETMGNVGVSKKVERVIGWRHEVSLVEGISRTVDWYKSNELWWNTRK